MAEAKRFQSIVRSVTISKDDMRKLLTMPFEEMDEWSPVKVVVLPDGKAVCEVMARSMVETIKENNRQGKITTFILPVGPTGQYPIAAEISNREGVSWKNVWTFNMDEYLDWENRPIPPDHPMSFKGAMERELFSRLNPELTVPPEQRWFPDPMDPDAIDRKIDEVTNGQGVDVTYGGIGEHGHIAFNEAPDLMAHYTHLTPEQFKNSKTRVLPHLNPETWARAFRMPLYTLTPPGAVTLGMRVLLGGKRIELAGWDYVTRIAAMHPPTMEFPVTYIQEHPNPKETVVIYAPKVSVYPRED